MIMSSPNVSFTNTISIPLPHTSTTTNDSRAEYPDIPLGKFIGISVGVSAGLGILINALVIAVVVLARKGRYSTYKYLMLHLAFADFFCSVMLIPYVPLELNKHHWIYSYTSPCKIIYSTISLLTNVSTGTILIITVERFRGVLFPHGRPWGVKDVWKAFFVVWTISICTVIPNIVTLEVKEYSNINYCNEVWGSIKYKRLYGFSYFAAAFAIPFVGILIMHSMIMIRLRFNDLRPDNMSTWQRNQNTRIMRVLTGIVIVFFVTGCPNKFLYFVWDMRPDLEKSLTSKTRFYLRTFQVLYWTRVAINPLIYCFFDTRFKKDLKKSSKLVRGQSFLDSEATRSRSASQRTSTVLSVRSRANSSFIGESEESNAMFKSNNINRMTSINEIDSTSLHTLYPVSETNGLNTLGYTDEPLGKRGRSDTVDTDVSSYNGSASPLVNSALTQKS